MLAGVSGYPRAGTVLHDEKCWQRYLCALTFVRTFGEHSYHGLSRQCGQCSWPDCPVSSPEGQAGGSGSTSALLDQPFASSAMGDSMDADLLPELSGETWVAATFLGQYVDHCARMGPGWFDTNLVGLCWTIPRVAILAAAIWKSIG